MVVSTVEPLGAVALMGGVLFLLGYFFRRDLLLGAVFVALLFQNLAYYRLLPVQRQLAYAVKHADDFLIVFFALALAVETFFPVVRLPHLPRLKPLALLVGVCVLSALANRLSLKETAVGVYVLHKSFLWFFLAAMIPLDERGYRNLMHFLVVVLGAVLAFGIFQLLTGELTYSLLGLPKDYRLGILRLRSIFVHPLYFGESMALLAILSVSGYIYLRKPVYLAVTAGAIIAVAMTMLVKTILALGLALGLLLLRKRPALAIPYAVAGLMAMVTFADYGTENLRAQIAMYIESPHSVRREGYRIAGEIIRDSPLLGVGPGQFGGFAATILDSEIPYRYDFIAYDGKSYSTFEAHWPHLVAEIGILGLLAYGVFLFFAARASWRVSTHPRASPYQRALGTTAAVFLVVVLLEAFAAVNLEDTLCGFMAFSMLGFTQRQPTEEVADSPETSEANRGE